MRIDTERYLEEVARRLQQDGYSCCPDVDLEEWQPLLQDTRVRLQIAGLVGRSEDPEPFSLDLVARKTESYALNKVEVAFFFSRIAALTPDGLTTFLAYGVAMAQAARPAPGKAMGVFCVALADDPDDLAVEEAEWGDLAASADAGAIPIPVILDVRYGQLHFLQQVPMLNNSLAVHQLRDLIHKYLLPGAGAVQEVGQGRP
jgi:hypothetical protein